MSQRCLRILKACRLKPSGRKSVLRPIGGETVCKKIAGKDGLVFYKRSTNREFNFITFFVSAPLSQYVSNWIVIQGTLSIIVG